MVSLRAEAHLRVSWEYSPPIAFDYFARKHNKSALISYGSILVLCLGEEGGDCLVLFSKFPEDNCSIAFTRTTYRALPLQLYL